MKFKVHYANAPKLTEDRMDYLDGNMRQVDLQMGKKWYEERYPQIGQENIHETHTMMVELDSGNETFAMFELENIFRDCQADFGWDALIEELNDVCRDKSNEVHHTSMMVGDVIEVVFEGFNRFFYCDRLGFSEIMWR